MATCDAVAMNFRDEEDPVEMIRLANQARKRVAARKNDQAHTAENPGNVERRSHG